jgi:predicted  nucleic acid-binding Zn-ribbon protein
MSPDQYKSLMEIQSLGLKIISHEELIEGQLKRLQHIEKIRQNREQERLEDQTLWHQFHQEFSLLEKNLAQTTTKLTQAEQKLANAQTQIQQTAAEHEISHLKLQKTNEENRWFELSELMENLKLKLTEHQEFLIGSLKSLQELKQEVDQIISIEKKHIHNYQSRIDSLLSEVDPKIKFRYEDLRKKTNRPLAYIINQNCEKCLCQISYAIIMNVEKMTSYETCLGCGRILLPHNTRS